ncbi:hypothetical protein [Diplocloster modestus]|uniref:DUF2178 domain-containing protein n=1 Tax=Diplocloster modestus TaxID=2850322 RepID=A0ABS6K5S3_9FIRM|nr:hypothetical protein [Diplocloster modestus]MBU9725870.1 hypothetical protein [Diplocloster modestus]
MNGFRKTVKHRIIMYGIGLLTAVAVVAAGIMTAGSAAGGSTDEMLSSFVSGLFFGFCILLIIYLVRLWMALKSETRLNALYRSENDERRQMIRQNALGKSFFITTGALVVGITVSAYYNKIVALTMAAVLAFHVTAAAVLKIYYLRKY